MFRFVKFSLIILFAILSGCGKDTPVPAGQDDTSSPGTPDGGTVSAPPAKPVDFLSDKDFDKLIVEVQYVKGYQPKAESVDRLQEFLQARLNKPAGITIMQNEVPSPGKAAYSLKDLQELEKEGRTQITKDKTLTAWFFFADGDFAANSGDSKVLGIAYGGSSMVIFEKTILEYSGGLTQPSVSKLESTVIHHEFAHIMGLVNNGTPMEEAHQDEPHGRHCTDKNCLMYYTAETTDIVGNLVGGSIPALDARCLNDLKANGGK